MTGNNYINLIDSSTLVFPEYHYHPVFVPPEPTYDINSEFTVSNDLTVEGTIRTFSFSGLLRRIIIDGYQELEFDNSLTSAELHIDVNGILYTDGSHNTKYVILPYAATTKERTNTIEVYDGNYYIPIVPEGVTSLDSIHPILCILFDKVSLSGNVISCDYNLTNNSISNEEEVQASSYNILNISKQINATTTVYITSSTEIFNDKTDTLHNLIKQETSA